MRLVLLTFILIVPSATYAAATIQSILTAFTSSVTLFVPLGVAVALIVFIAGIVRFIYSSGDEKEVEVGRQRMVWGVVALFFIVSMWGVVKIMQVIVGVGADGKNNCTGVTITGNGGTTCL